MPPLLKCTSLPIPVSQLQLFSQLPTLLHEIDLEFWVWVLEEQQQLY